EDQLDITQLLLDLGKRDDQATEVLALIGTAGVQHKSITQAELALQRIAGIVRQFNRPENLVGGTRNVKYLVLLQRQQRQRFLTRALGNSQQDSMVLERADDPHVVLLVS